MTPDEIAQYGQPKNKYAHCVTTDTYRRCNCCATWLQHSDFSVNRRDSAGLYTVCKKCQKLKRDGNYKGPRTTRIEELTASLPKYYGELLPGCSRTTTTHQRCCKCKQWKAHSEFYNSRSGVNGLKGECKPCCTNRRAIDQLAKYGFTPADFNNLLASQHGKCAICSSEANVNGSRLFVDHDHITGKVRGLLCHHCNVAIGSLRDDPELLERAAKYLRDRT
jgi:hypothetical protein